MQAGMYSNSVPVLARMLNNLSKILDKAAAHAEARNFDPSVLLQSRLFPDMFPLQRQVQLSTDFAKGCAARLAGVEIPKFSDTEVTIPELQDRLARTVAFIESLDQAAIEGSAERAITIPMRDRKVELKGLEYLNNMAMPNFYFHVTTAYDILRHNGVEVGKRDFVGI